MEEPERSDEQLFANFLDGDGEGFHDLVRRYEGPLFAYLFRFTGDAGVAEDVFQDAFLKVHRNRGGYDRGMAFKPWLYSIAINTARDWYRHHRHEPRLLSGDIDVPDGRPSPDKVLQDAETGERIAAAVARLPEIQRQVFLLRQYEDLPYDVIASMLERPVNTVKSDMHRALQRLRGLLDSLAEPAEDDR